MSEKAIVIAADNRDARLFADRMGLRSWASCTPVGIGERGVEATEIYATPRAIESNAFVDLRARALVCTASRHR